MEVAVFKPIGHLSPWSVVFQQYQPELLPGTSQMEGFLILTIFLTIRVAVVAVGLAAEVGKVAAVAAVAEAAAEAAVVAEAAAEAAVVAVALLLITPLIKPSTKYLEWE